MTSLAWLLYLGDVVHNVQIILGAVCFVTGIGSLFVIMAWCSDSLSPEADELVPGWIFKALIALGISAFLAALIPNQNTIYAIAALKIGDKVVANETVQNITSDATKALQQWIKKQITEEKK